MYLKIFKAKYHNFLLGNNRSSDSDFSIELVEVFL